MFDIGKSGSRVLSFILVLSMILAFLPNVGVRDAYALEEVNTYNIQLEETESGGAGRWSDATGTYKSEDKINFYWVWSWPNIKELSRTGDDPLITCGIFKLNNTENTEVSVPAYCCDFIFSAIGGSYYERINLEECSYFSREADAAKIRGIFEECYWPIKDVTDEEYLNTLCTDANAWLVEYKDNFDSSVTLPMNPDDVSGCSEIVRSTLTRDQAITASQLAVWSVANEAGYWGTDYKYIVPVKDNTDDTDVNNIRVIWAYLMSLDSVEPSEVLITDNNFLQESAIFTKSEGVGSEATHTVTMKFKMRADIDSNDSLVFKAILTNSEGNFEKSLNSSEMVKDSEGYYSVVFEDVKSNGSISLSVSGQQYAEDVYFYEAKAVGGDSARESSQNMVGKYAGLTNVKAEMGSAESYELGQVDVKITVYDSSQEASEGVPVGDKFYVPVEGAEFDLYAQESGNDEADMFVVEEGLVSDENGKVEVKGLVGGYDYFFKPVNSPEGYDPLGDDFIKSDTNPNIAIKKIPVTDIVVNVKWVGDDSSTRPEEVKIQLEKDGVAFEDKVGLSEGNSWTYTFKNVDSRHEYTVDELNIERYNTEISKEGNEITVTNTYVPVNISKKIVVEWSGDREGNRPESLEVQLLKDGEPFGDKVILNKDNGWTHTWEGLDDRYNYSVENSKPNGYNSSIVPVDDGFKVVNEYISTPSVDRKSIISSVDLFNVDNEDALNTIEVQLLRDGEPYGDKVILEKEKQYRYVWSGLRYGYEYTVDVLTEAPGYEFTVDGGNIDVVFDNSTFNVDIFKELVYDGEYDGESPEFVINVIRDGVDTVGSFVLDKDSGYECTVEGLNKYNPLTGLEYIYSFEEVPLEGYTLTKANFDKESGTYVTISTYVGDDLNSGSVESEEGTEDSNKGDSDVIEEFDKDEDAYSSVGSDSYKNESDSPGSYDSMGKGNIQTGYEDNIIEYLVILVFSVVALGFLKRKSLKDR